MHIFDDSIPIPSLNCWFVFKFVLWSCWSWLWFKSTICLSFKPFKLLYHHWCLKIWEKSHIYIYIYVKMHVCKPSVPRRPRRRTARRWRSCSARSGAQSLRKSRRNGATALRSAPPPGDGETSGQHRGCGGHGHGMGWWKMWWKYGSI